MKILNLALATLFMSGTGAYAQGTTRVSRPVLAVSIAAFQCTAWQNGAGFKEAIDASIDFYRPQIDRVGSDEQFVQEVYAVIENICPDDITKAHQIHNRQRYTL